MGTLAARATMSGGRPRKTEGGRATKHIRVYDDLADMVSWILRVEDITSAALLDPLLRGAITARYAKHERAIKLLQKAQDEARKSAQDG